MSPMHVLTEMFAPTPCDGIAFSALPGAPMLPVTERRRRRRRLRRVGASIRRAGGRVYSSLPLATSAPAPVRAGRPTS